MNEKRPASGADEANFATDEHACLGHSSPGPAARNTVIMSDTSNYGKTPSDALGDPPPHDEAAEKALLGAIFRRGGVLDDPAAAVAIDDLYSDRHQAIYGAVLALRNAGRPTNDVVLLAEELDRTGRLENAGGTAYLVEIMEAVPHAEHAPHYAGIIRDKSDRRHALRLAEQIANRARDPNADLRFDFESLAKSLGEVRGTQSAGRTICLADVEAREIN